MQQLHNTYQALKQGVEKLYDGVSSFSEAVLVEKVRKPLDEAVVALEDVLGITQARLDGAARLAEEAKPKITQVDAPGLVPESPTPPAQPSVVPTEKVVPGKETMNTDVATSDPEGTPTVDAPTDTTAQLTV